MTTTFKSLHLFFICFCFLLIGCDKQNKTYQISEKDKKEIENIKTQLPLILANEGWEAYENMFSKNYKNWAMLTDKVRERDEFLPLVKQWYDEGNRAIDSDVQTIDFIPIAEHKVMYLHRQTETFNLMNTEETISRAIRFVAIFVREDGQWKVDFTAFMDEPKTKTND